MSVLAKCFRAGTWAAEAFPKHLPGWLSAAQGGVLEPQHSVIDDVVNVLARNCKYLLVWVGRRQDQLVAPSSHRAGWPLTHLVTPSSAI